MALTPSTHDAPRLVKLLLGYLPNVDYPHRTATSSRLSERFCLIMPAQVRGKVCWYFDFELLLELLDPLLKLIDHQQAFFGMDPEGHKTLRTLDELRQHYVGRPPAHREPFHWAWLVGADDSYRGLIQFTDQTHSKANTPYRGCYCFAFYVRQYDRQEVLRACEAGCRAAGATLTRVIEGQPRPSISLWTKLYDFIVYHPGDEERGVD